MNRLNHEFKRHHLAEKKDLDNIRISFGLNDTQRHPNDQASVRSWVEEWNNSEGNPILFSKFQGDEPPDGSSLMKEDFLIVIQNLFQKLMAQKFAQKGVCIDATHGTTGYDFLLTSLVVLDEFGEGFPVAWCLSNHEDFTHMCVFFEMVKQNCGVLSPHWIMSDLASQFFNAWIAIMGGHPKWLFCTWHVDRAWQEELRVKVKDTIIAAEIYLMLRAILQQTDVSVFQEYKSQVLKCLPNLNVDFAHYFEREWCGKAESWAYCYRKGMGINTNMAVEAFHRVFKYNYLKGKANKRVDNCMVNLLQYIRDKSFDRAIKLTKGKSTAKMKLISDRHNKSKAMCTDNVVEDGESRWQICSETSSLTYTILQQANYCMDDTCQVKCEICIHQYLCDCPDSLIHNTICKHIHLLKRYLSKKEEKRSTCAAEQVQTKKHEDTQYKKSELQLVASHIKNKDKFLSHDLASQQEAIKRQLLILIEQVNDCQDKDALTQLNKQVTAAHHMFVSMKKHKCSTPLKPVTSSPANKNIHQQRTFKSTKKKRKRTNEVRFCKPNQDNISALFALDKNGIVSCTHFGTKSSPLKALVIAHDFLLPNMNFLIHGLGSKISKAIVSIIAKCFNCIFS